jgi:hypothetical protein
MNLELFKLALDRIQPHDWEIFEELSSSFLVSEFSQLRTMAHPAGDGGRDSELFQCESKSFIAFQYSVSSDWKSKIRRTVVRITDNFKDIRIIIYLTNQQIGGQADELKREILEKGISLDIRDKNWFLERALLGDERLFAAERIIDKIARPYLVDEKIISKESSPLTSNEAKAALLYLGLQLQDDNTNKGLTKLSFDALVRSVLRSTNSENRLSRKIIQERIIKILPSTDQNTIFDKIDSALKRLTKRYIRHWVKEDEFCLTYEEHQRILVRLAENENEISVFNKEIIEKCEKCLIDNGITSSENIEELSKRVPRIIESILNSKGELFVTAVITNNMDKIENSSITDIIINDLSKYPPQTNITEHLPKILLGVINVIFSQPSQSTNQYLKRLSNSYTLFSFLRETPDIQSATSKLFSHGAIWLDTTVLLPAIAEQLKENEQDRKLLNLFKACSNIGIELFVTPGVLDEIIAHMKLAINCSHYHYSSWKGRIPYLYNSYLETGKSPLEFSKWISLFKGDERPAEDISLFLHGVYNINKNELSTENLDIDEEIIWVIRDCWTAEHQKRRQQNQLQNDNPTDQLIKHDVETYLGIIALRQKEDVSELGYKNWLLTFDKTAWYIRDKLRNEYKAKQTPSPLMSIDYLIRNISFSPNRNLLSKNEHDLFPIILDIEMSESMPINIMEISNEVRKENEGLPEYVIRRKVRDAIDKARRKYDCSSES